MGIQGAGISILAPDFSFEKSPSTSARLVNRFKGLRAKCHEVSNQLLVILCGAQTVITILVRRIRAPELLYGSTFILLCADHSN